MPPSPASHTTSLRTRVTILIICTLLAVLLLVSGLSGLYETVWKNIDTGIFRSLNSTITADGIMTQFWALTNSKNFDRFTFVVMLGLCIYIVASSERQERISAAARIGAITILILIAVGFSKKVIGDFYHPSPGYLLSPFNNINDFITGYTVKTSTDNSFPGDHAMTSALFAGGVILLFRDRPAIAVLSVLLMIFVSVPRLAGGGHWFTDVVVGGGAACLILLPWLTVIPLVDWVEKGIIWGWSKAPAFLKK